MPQKLRKKNSCPRTCILSVLSLLSSTKSPNITLIKRFIDEFKYITNTFTSHQSYLNFLKFLRSSKLVKCKIGLFYFEKYLLVSDYELIFFDLDLFYQNQFVNNKIILFSWLKPDHLEISLHPQYLEKVTNNVCDINTLFTPSEKMAQIIEIAKIIYFFHGKNLSQENFLPIFIYTIIHFQIKNLIYNLNFIKRYFGIPMNKCKLNCLHLEECENEKCECVTFISDVNLKEQEFYLTNFEAAINFIEMIDFNLIKANVQEYCDNIERLTNFIDRTKIPKKIRKEASLAQKAKIKFVKISEFVKDYFKKNF